MKLSYTWLKSYIDELPPKEELGDILTRHVAEVEGIDGDVIDLNVLPNRAHDMLSHQGVAQEIAGILGVPFKDPTVIYKIPESERTDLQIDIQTDSCRRYMGRIVRNVKVGPSPEWVKTHLESIGQKSINNIVDATNIVMFDCGNPTHVFDADKLENTTITVAENTKEQTVSLLGGEERGVVAGDAVILNNEKVLALAGVKGGVHAEVDENTKNVVIEVANFDPVSVRKTARRLGLLTDSAKRFENNLSPERAEYAMTELSALIVEMCPEAVFEEIVDVYPNPQQEKTVAISLGTVNSILGISITKEEIEKIFSKYGYTYTQEGDIYTITVPPLRLDLTGAHDMVEEVGRLYGYDKVEPKLPEGLPVVENTEYKQLAPAREKLLVDGYSEVMTYAFRKKGKIVVARGVKGKDALRKNLSDGLTEAYEMNRLNAPLIGVDEVKLFEVGTVFPTEDTEEIHVAWIDKSGVKEMKLEEFEGSDTISPVSYKTEPFTEWSVYPHMTRDIALWVEEGVEASEVQNILKEYAGEYLVREPRLFDTFSKDGKTSYAFRLVFQSMDKTLTDADIEPGMEKIGEILKKKGWEIR